MQTNIDLILVVSLKVVTLQIICLTKVWIDPAKKWGKKCSTGQRFIFTEVISYKIYTLVCNQQKLIKKCK